ncbi:MAG: GAF domain-containing protein, partial [Anaerolineaceae bacterium]|nr:GAF domain-containing protein [Anaerolineaceae bacterium]
GSLYFIPADQQPVIPEEMHSVVLLPTTEKNAPDLWDADDFLLIPLYNTEHEPIGMISVDDPRDGRRPDRPTLEALELFGTQASLMVENHLHLTAMEARLRESGSGSTVDLPLHMERLQAGMEIAEVAAHQTDPQVLLREVARELIRRFNMSYALVVENTPSGPHLVDKVGDLPAKMNPEALFGQRNPLRQVFASGHSLLSADIVSSQEWLDSPLLSSLEAKSFLALPIRRSEDRSSAILVTGKEALPVFSREDERVVDQLVRQVSIGIQNLDLLAETRRHLTEVDLMLQFSRKLGSLDADEILGSLISSALEVIEAADAGWVGILDRTKNTLTPRASRGYPKGDSLQDICMNYDPGISQTDDLPLPLRSALSARTLRVAEVNFVKDYSLSQDDLLHYRNAVAGRLPVSSLVVPIRLTGDAEGVLVLDNFSTAGSFNEEDESLVASLTQQSALGLENARLFRGAGQRASQLQALTQVAATLTSSLQSSDLLGSLLGLLHSVLPYQTATLWLREDDQLHIAAAEGFEDSQSRLGITAQVKDSALFQEMVVSGQAIMVPDIRQDVRFSTLIEPDRLSWLGIPLVAKSQLVGLIALEKTEANGYSPEDVQIGMTFAGQAAVALDNARLFEESNQRATELDQRSERLALLNRLSGDLAASLDVDYILKLSLQQLLDALKLDRAAGILVDEQNQFVLQTEVPPSLEKLPLVLPELSLLRRLRESQGIFYTNDVTTDPEAAPLMPVYLEQRGARSLLIVPLIAGSNFHGWILLMAEDTYRFSTPEIELARTISNQAAIAIQNARLFAETRRLTADLERRVEERTAELTQEHRNSQTLLRIITELSNSLDLDQVLNRALTVLVESIGVDQAIIVLSQSPMVYSAGEAITTITKEN